MGVRLSLSGASVFEASSNDCVEAEDVALLGGGVRDVGSYILSPAISATWIILWADI